MEGFLGPYLWASAHVLESVNRRSVFKKYLYPPGRAGNICAAAGISAESELQRTRLVDHLRNVLSLPPLLYSREDCAQFGLSGHTAHDTDNDMMTYIGEQRGPQFTDGEKRVAGNWRRRQQQDTAVVSGVRNRQEAARAQDTAQPATLHNCEVRYSLGEHRQGGRELQYDVRLRMQRAGQQALALEQKHWSQLPRGAADFAIFRRLPPWNGTVPAALTYNRPLPAQQPAAVGQRPPWHTRIVLMNHGTPYGLLPTVVFGVRRGSPLGNMFPLSQGGSAEPISRTVAIEAFSRVLVNNEEPAEVALDLGIVLCEAQVLLFRERAHSELEAMAMALSQGGDTLGLDCACAPEACHAEVVANHVWTISGLE